MPLTAMCAVSSALERASTYIGRISQASFTSFPAAAATTADVTSETPSKKKRTEASLVSNAAAGTLSSQDVARSLSHLSSSLQGISEHIVNARALALSEASSSLSVFSAQETLGECSDITCIHFIVLLTVRRTLHSRFQRVCFSLSDSPALAPEICSRTYLLY